MKRVDAKTLVGEVLTHVDVLGEEGIMLTTESGRRIKIYHEQDCCEHVRIVGTDGEWKDLYGKVIDEVDHKAVQSDVALCESKTDSTLTFKAGYKTVISRWIGESNGYYSESVDLMEIDNDTA